MDSFRHDAGILATQDACFAVMREIRRGKVLFIDKCGQVV